MVVARTFYSTADQYPHEDGFLMSDINSMPHARTAPALSNAARAPLPLIYAAVLASSGDAKAASGAAPPRCIGHPPCHGGNTAPTLGTLPVALSAARAGLTGPSDDLSQLTSHQA